MSWPIIIGPSGAKIESVKAPYLELYEVTKVETISRGKAFNRGDIEEELSLEQWAKLYATNGDMSAIGFDLKDDQPVSGIEEYE